MDDKSRKNKKLTFGKVLLILLIAVFVFIMFPRRQSILDGGTVYYTSGLGGIIYTVKHLHESVRENKTNYFRKGIRIYIFGRIVYEDSYVDYDHPEPTGLSPEYYEASRQLESAMDSWKNDSQESSTSAYEET